MISRNIAWLVAKQRWRLVMELIPRDLNQAADDWSRTKLGICYIQRHEHYFIDRVSKQQLISKAIGLQGQWTTVCEAGWISRTSIMEKWQRQPLWIEVPYQFVEEVVKIVLEQPTLTGIIIIPQWHHKWWWQPILAMSKRNEMLVDTMGPWNRFALYLNC
jgi:hypothetical protein